MISKFALSMLAVLGLSLTVFAQDIKAPAPVQIRAVLHDPVNPIANLFYTDKAGGLVQLNFKPQALTDPMFTVPVNGSLVLYDTATIDPENPAASIAANVKLPPDQQQMIVVILAAPAGEEPAYRMLLIDDSDKAFPFGESRVLSLIGVETAIEAGEHKLSIPPGKITKVSAVKKVNEFNIAQTNFYYKVSDVWTPFTERQLQYLDVCRRIFIIYATPGALQPTITTIVDTNLKSARP